MSSPPNPADKAASLVPQLLLNPKLYGNYDKYPQITPPRVQLGNTGAFSDTVLQAIIRFCGVDLTGSVLLDIGCGAGYSSLQLAREAKTALVVGIDVDAKLVSKARRLMRAQRAVASAAAQSAAASAGASNAHSDATGDAARTSNHSTDAADAPQMPSMPAARTVPLSLPMDHGPILPVARHSADCCAAPPPCLFRVGDILSPSHCLTHATSSVDAVLCVGITKWLHMQGGDAGMTQFFHFVYRVLKPGGTFIIQPQRRGSYCSRACKLGPVHVHGGAGGAAPWRAGDRHARGQRSQRPPPPPTNGKWPLRYDMHVPPEEFPKLLVQGVGFHSVRRLRLPPDQGRNSASGSCKLRGHAPVFIATKGMQIHSPVYSSPSPPRAPSPVPRGGGALHSALSSKRPRGDTYDEHGRSQCGRSSDHADVGDAAAAVSTGGSSAAGQQQVASAAAARGSWRLGPAAAQQPQIPVTCREGWGGEP